MYPENGGIPSWKRWSHDQIIDDFWQLHMGQRQSPQPKIRCCIGDRPKDKLYSFNDRMDHDFTHTFLDFCFSFFLTVFDAFSWNIVIWWWGMVALSHHFFGSFCCSWLVGDEFSHLESFDRLGVLHLVNLLFLLAFPPDQSSQWDWEKHDLHHNSGNYPAIFFSYSLMWIQKMVNLPKAPERWNHNGNDGRSVFRSLSRVILKPFVNDQDVHVEESAQHEDYLWDCHT